MPETARRYTAQMVRDLPDDGVEVWHPGDERPAIVTGALRWQVPGASELEVSLADLFGPPV